MAAVTEQTTEPFDLKIIGFIQRGRIHPNFSHSKPMVCQGHTALKIVEFDPDWGFWTVTPVLIHQWLRNAAQT